MSEKRNKLYYQEFLRRERGVRHHRYDEELRALTMVKRGEEDGIKLCMQMFFSNFVGELSEDTLRSYKYLFVCSVTLITRFCIEADMEEEFAFNTSDYYIQQVDRCQSLDEVRKQYRDMLEFYTHYMAALRKGDYSKHIILCMDFIYNHLYEKITVQRIAEQLHLNPNYLSVLFKREIGQTISDYIVGQRMEAAKNMLLYSDATCSEISAILAYSSQSYFIKQFRQTFGCTPKEYQRLNFQQGFERNTDAQPLR